MKIKYMAILLILLCFMIGAASAADDGTVDSLDAAQDDAVSIDAVEDADEVASTEPTSTQTDEKLEQSNDDEKLEVTRTVEVNNFNEFKNAMDSAVNDAVNDTYVINLNPGTYTVSSLTTLSAGTNTPNIIINGNGQSITSSSKRLTFSTGGDITINDLTFGNHVTNSNTKLILNHVVLEKTLTNNMNVTIIDSTINGQITNSLNLNIINSTINGAIVNTGILTIDELSTVGSGFKKISGAGKIYTTNTAVINRLKDNYIFIGEHSLANTTINTAITNYGSLTIENSTINNGISNYEEITIKNSNITQSFGNYGQISFIKANLVSSAASSNKGNITFADSNINSPIINNGILTICDDVIFGSSCAISGNGQIIINNTSRITPYMNEYDGDYILENVVISIDKTNNGNLTIRNSTVNSKITNNGILTICDDVIFGSSCAISGNGQIIINNTSRITPYMNEYNGDYILENVVISQYKRNNGNLTVIGCTFNAIFVNNGKLIIRNSTINYQITNYGNLIIYDDVIFGTSCVFSGNGQIIINDTNKLVPYLVELNGDYVLENLSNMNGKTNNGNLTIRNSTITGSITNNGNLTIANSTVTNTITNTGTLWVKNTTVNRIQNTGTVILDDDVDLGSNFFITGGKVIANDYSKLFPYLGEFNAEATVELGNYNNIIITSGNLTIENTTFNEQVLNSNPGKLTIINSITNTNKPFSNSGTMEFINSTINTTITNTGILIISEDTILGENFKIAAGYGGVEGQVITNNTQLIDYVDIYKGDIVLSNKTINIPKTNKGRLTLNNCTIDSTISNDGIIIIDEDTVFGENAKITGTGEIKINDLSRILPIIDTINGNYEIKDTELTKKYAFNGEVTLINCTITNPDNANFGTLKLNNCTVNVGEENTFLTNYGTVTISKDTKITGKIINLVENGVIYEGAPKTYIVTQDTIGYFFDEAGLTSIVNPGDTLNIQGTIKLNRSLTIDKPVNIISTTNDAYIDLNTTAGDYFGSNQGNKFAITKDGAYTNVTGIYFHNTQLWIYETHHVTLDGISAVVENQRVGSGVGVTSIRQNSSYITVKNSYFYTKDNEGSSTLVLAWANYCTIENNTIVGEGTVGNLLYLTTYNVNIPQGSMINSHNKLINNRITGPESAAICYGICISGYDNLVDNNTITYSGSGITYQWGSGVTGIEQDESLIGSGENVVSNNKLYGGCGISAGDLIYNNYMEGTLSAPKNSKAYNNTAKGLELAGNSSEVYNNTIEGKATFADSVTNVIVENNNIAGNIIIPATSTNNVISNNNITGSVTLDGSFNNLTNNRIITNGDYAVSSNKLGKNNNLTGNYLVANGKVGNDAVSLRDESNVIASAGVVTKVEVSVPGEVTVNKTVQVTIKLTDANGNPLDGQVIVSSALGSETVNVTKGTGVYQYTPKAIGEDTISVKFAGNDTFYLSSNSSNVNVIAEKAPAQQNETKTPTKTPAKTVVSLSFVKAPKKVSKKAKKLIISAKLKVNGKLAKGKKLTFKFKGKTFKVKTNKKGVAKLTIKSKVLKKLLKKVKAGKKVKYQVSYGKKTVKKTLKVKK